MIVSRWRRFSRGSFRPRRIEQASREVAATVNDSDDVESVATNAVEDEMPVEWLSNEEEPDPDELGVRVIRLFPDPRMRGQQPHRVLDRIGETLRQGDTFPLRIIVRLQRDVGE